MCSEGGFRPSIRWHGSMDKHQDRVGVRTGLVNGNVMREDCNTMSWPKCNLPVESDDSTGRGHSGGEGFFLAVHHTRGMIFERPGSGFQSPAAGRTMHGSLLLWYYGTLLAASLRHNEPRKHPALGNYAGHRKDRVKSKIQLDRPRIHSWFVSVECFDIAQPHEGFPLEITS